MQLHFISLFLLCHFFLLYLVVDHVARGKLAVDILKADALLDHQDHHVIDKVRDLVDRFGAILCLSGNDDLGALLADLFEDLVKTLFKQIRGIGALFFVGLSAADQLH